MLAQLPEQIRFGMELQVENAASALADRRYNVVVVGRDLAPTDFFDEVHLMAAGGEKMAAEIADFIRPLAVRLNYLPADRAADTYSKGLVDEPGRAAE
jgi:hypothetical protein